MTCSEVRQYLFAFLDNELDAVLSMDVQQHLERCPICARECEIEHVIQQRLAVNLQAGADVPDFDGGNLDQLLSAEPLPPSAPAAPRMWRVRRLALRGALAASLVFAATLLIVFGTGNHEKDASFVDMLVDDFEHFVDEGQPLQVASSSPDEVAEWLRERTDLAVRLPAVDPTLGALMGGRKCKIHGVPAAFAIYRMGAGLASVVALRESDRVLTGWRRIERDGHTHWIDECRGHTILACRRGDLLYLVVSRLSEQELAPLMHGSEI